MDTNKRTVSIDHAASILGVSRRTIYHRISDGYIQTIKVNGTRRVIVESLVKAPGAGQEFAKKVLKSLSKDDK
jgi:excisionase family DNA binding protein